jgi:hypothetical protein
MVDFKKLRESKARCGNRAVPPPWPSPEGGCPSR